MSARPDESPPDTAPATVRVRIAVSVTARGEWHAWGVSDLRDETVAHKARYAFGEGAHLVWVEADVPLPKAAVVGGRVTGYE